MGNDMALSTGLKKTVLISKPTPLGRFPKSETKQEPLVVRHTKAKNVDDRPPLHLEVLKTSDAELRNEALLRTPQDQQRVQRIDVQMCSLRKYRIRRYPKPSPLHFHKPVAHLSISPIAREMDPTPRLALENIQFEDSREIEQTKSARLIKRYKLNKQKFSEATLFSSEEEQRREEGMTPQHDVSPAVFLPGLSARDRGLNTVRSFKPSDTSSSITITRQSGSDHRSSIFSFIPAPSQERKNLPKKSLLLVQNPETPRTKSKKQLSTFQLPKRSL